jgi:hypothetical protein
MKHRRILVPAILFCSVVIVACEGSNPVDVSDGDAMSVLHAKGVSNLGQPSAVTAAAVGTDRVDASWQDNSGNEDGFEIHRSIASAPYALLTTTLPNAEQHNDERHHSVHRLFDRLGAPDVLPGTRIQSWRYVSGFELGLRYAAGRPDWSQCDQIGRDGNCRAQLDRQFGVRGGIHSRARV